MEIRNFLKVESRAELRRWLMQNHRTASECWVAVRRGKPRDDGTFRYLDAVEEALCFGWIDSTVKKTADGATVQKFSPRKAKSSWTELNKERCRRLERLGLMTEAGRAVLPDMTDGGFVIDRELLHELQSDPLVWEHFLQLPELYKRVRIDRIQYLKNREPRLYRSRLDKFIRNTRQGILYGEWNDGERLP
ncbi:MAG: YdeI/OmpD-associated family protein [Rikenellaceae bacterium]|nr:YdeI/OmpD-associated family protein [Rikenellaceae bacterium]